MARTVGANDANPGGSLRTFKIERFFVGRECRANHLLFCSDAEPRRMSEYLELADAEARELWENLVMGYTELKGHPLLREAVAARYEGATAEDVAISSPPDLIHAVSVGLVRPGDHIVAQRPSYQSLYEIARVRGAHVTFWEPSSTPEGDLAFTVEGLRAAIRPNTRLVALNFPNNPTGYLPTPAEFREMVDIVRETGAYLLSDEMYRGMEHDPEDRLPAAAEIYDRGLSLSGTSKALGMPGSRIGWIVCRDQYAHSELTRVKDYTSSCPPAPSEILALIAVRNWDFLADRSMELVLRNIRHMDAFARRWPGAIRWRRPRAAAIAYVPLTLPGVTDAADFCSDLLDEHRILLLPDEVFRSGDEPASITRATTLDAKGKGAAALATEGEGAAAEAAEGRDGAAFATKAEDGAAGAEGADNKGDAEEPSAAAHIEALPPLVRFGFARESFKAALDAFERFLEEKYPGAAAAATTTADGEVPAQIS